MSTDSDLSKLKAIRTKVRRLTRTTSEAQLSNDDIDNYINTFVLYDFPEFLVDKKIPFYLMPNIDTYGDNTKNLTDPLYNFKNIYTNIKAPIYVGGTEIYLSTDRNEFFSMYPQVLFEENVGTGNSIITAYSGTLSHHPINPKSINFSSVDASGNGIVIKDLPQVDGTSGVITTTGLLVIPDTTTSVGTINYHTGVYTFTFPVAPGTSEPIIAQMYAYEAGKPNAVLFDNQKLTFRPIPDKTYKVELSVFQRPTALIAADSVPELAQWWQYIAYGAAKKIYEDRMDTASLETLMPEFNNQRLLVLERNIIQRGGQRTATIYSQGGSFRW